jgi:hypothetical protein
VVLTVKGLTYKVFSVTVLVVAAVVTGLSIRQAVRQDSFEPILLIAWLPAVLVGAYYRRPASGRRCSDRLLRRSNS